jgi:hypothetical protein
MFRRTEAQLPFHPRRPESEFIEVIREVAAEFSP